MNYHVTKHAARAFGERVLNHGHRGEDLRSRLDRLARASVPYPSNTTGSPRRIVRDAEALGRTPPFIIVGAIHDRTFHILTVLEASQIHMHAKPPYKKAIGNGST